ncbi:cobalt-precorrin-6A reductase [Thiohalocapsa halophila]|uniref:Cobalt-precorrin-6A reductase n=1 Tax=Thiohalocapsa halophila TaxID=69359 RepID=A0ABS1CMB1_9GAMM|nr:cobalt-precorrin-6A reductase [Thiohalocapsa halophila]MBK1633062.1 cobalt-precorrin-6A reductase [Thiohalocapsa halophila]
MRRASPATILILGGTSEGYALAEALAPQPSLRVVTSLAGRTPQPRRPVGELRSGGFGGADGLAAYLAGERVAAVIDATHPFAATMGAHAAQACAQLGVPLLRLERPAWTPEPGDRWEQVSDWYGAVFALRMLGVRRVLLALGRRELSPFAMLDDVWFLVRCVSRPDPLPAFAHAELLLDRGPFELDGERALLARHGIDCIVCKNSGGAASAAKLQAARERGIPVVMRERPPRPALPTAPDVAAAVQWLREALGAGAGSGNAD